MKLIRPKITPSPWVQDDGGNIVTSPHDKDGPDDDVCEVYGGNSDDDLVRKANSKAISQVPEIMDDLEKILWAADRYKDEPKKQTLALFDIKEWAEKALTRMGYTQEEEKE